MRQLVPLLNPAIFYAAKFLLDKSSLGLHDMGSTIDAGENNGAMQMHTLLQSLCDISREYRATMAEENLIGC